MKNKCVKIVLFILLILFLSCKKAYEHKQQTSKSNISDTLVAEIDDNYNLKLRIGNKVEMIDFFEPIKEQLLNEKMYVQILYDKKNVIINLEIGQNADIYLSKLHPIIIEKNIQTTIIKTKKFPEKLECEEAINKPLLIVSRYKSIDKKVKTCTQEKLK